MALIYKIPKVFQYSLYQRTLTTAGNDTYLYTVRLYLSHEVYDSWHNRSFWHLMEDTTLLVIHYLSLCLIDLTTLLFHHHHTDGIYTSCSFSGIGIISSHLDAELSHALLPRNSMIRHRVIEHSIHIKEHGFEVDTLKAVSF